MKDTYGAVSLLGGRSLPGEQDELGAVLLQALHIGLKRFCGSVAATGVNCNADGAGCLFVDAGRLQRGALS